MKKRLYLGRTPSGLEYTLTIEGWAWEAKALAEKMFDVENGGKILKIEVLSDQD